MAIFCVLSGCALHNGGNQFDPQTNQAQRPVAELSAAVRRLPPVFDPAQTPSLATADTPPPGVRLQFRTESAVAGENYQEALPAAPAEIPAPKDVPAPKDIVVKSNGSQTVPAVFRPDPGAASGNPLSADAIMTEWRESPGAVTNVSNDEPSGRSVVTDVSRQRAETALQVQFAGADPTPAPPVTMAQPITMAPPVRPAGPASPEPMAVPKPEGLTPVRLRLDDVEVRKALEMLSLEASANILVAPGVTGQVTANLQGLTFDEAFGAILKLCNLVAHRENNLIFVFPLADVPQSTLNLRAFPLDFVSSDDAMLGVQGLLSPTGKAFLTQSSSGDNRKTQDMIVVEDVPDYLFRVEQYLGQIDRPPRQVMIEVHVLDVELIDERRHGVNFDHAINFMGNTTHLQVSGLANPLAGQAFFVDVDGANLDALIEWLKTTTDAKTLASPKVLVLNGQEARIQIGEQLGYQVITTTETASMQDVKFLDLGVVLTVTPHISRDNQVVMRIRPEVSSGIVNPETGLPEEETTEVETDVLLRDGQGIVIGGLIQERDSDVQVKVPVLGDLWVIGWLFQRREIVRRRSEIIITLIPRVLPYLPDYEVQDQFETTRAATPLVYGPLCRYPRPWEPRFPDTNCRLRDCRCASCRQ